MRREIRLEVTYPHPPERVWKALTDRKALEKWLMPNDFLPRLGHRFRFVREGAGRRKREEVQCEVVELDAPRRLAYTWRSDPETPPELVCWTLEPVEAGTRLRLEHLAPEEGLEDIAVPFTAQYASHRAKHLSSRLAAYLNPTRRATFRKGRALLQPSVSASRRDRYTESEVTHA